MNRDSLKFKIPFFIIIFAICCVFLTGSILQYIVSDNLEKKAMEKNMIISRMISNQISLYLEDARKTVVTASNFSSQSYGDLSQIKQEIFRIYDNFDYFSLIFFMNSDAKMVFSKPTNKHVKNRVYTDRSYYWDIMNGKESTISPLLISSVLGKPHFIIAAPVYDSTGEKIGLIGAGIPLDNIKKVIEKTQKQFNGNIWMTDENGVMAVHPEMDVDFELIKMVNRRANAGKIETDFESIFVNQEDIICDYNIEGRKLYGAVTFMEETNWMIVVEQDEEAIFSEVLELQNKLKSVMVIVILVALISGLILARKITNPIEGLVNQIRKLSGGLKEIQPIEIDLKSKDEIGELAKAFGDMSIKLHKNVKALENSYNRENRLQQYLNNILRSLKSGILVINKRSRITVLNKELEAITEFDSEIFMNRNIDEFWKKTGLSLEYTSNGVLNEGKTFTDIEVIMKNKYDKEIYLNVSASAVVDNDKNVLGVVYLFRDLTRIKIIEEELNREDRIRTLGELSASIIHDIGNPLAGIGNLIEILQEDICDAEMKEEVLDVLEKEVSDLNNLVINFLDFSRTSKHEKESTNIKKLVKDIINLLKPEIIAKKIKLTRKFVDKEIYLNIERRSIKQSLINIFKNSIQAVNIGGEIYVEIDIREEFVAIIIRDNGVGIDKEKLENIFYPFFTTKEEGTGLGLFIAYNVVKEHGGQINVKSDIGKETEFLITLPISDTKS
ncbi:cache domain-containing protein [Wukongibacter baidiensis]|uniref:ATP-binding protein n=1 Tax=Wukongibacter baidiensis TaxID=1723361 RepID=UPI003D7F660D